MWGRLSPHPALEPRDAAESRRVRPTRSRRLRSLCARTPTNSSFGVQSNSEALSAARTRFSNRSNTAGALLCRDRAATKRLPSEVEEALWQLVAAGFSDGRRLRCAGARSAMRNAAWVRGAFARGRARRAGAGRSCKRRPSASRRTPSRGACWPAGALYSATSSPARAWRQDGANCCSRAPDGGARRNSRRRFVAGFVGEQFALPEAIDALRAVRRTGAGVERLPLGAYDPLNLAGIIYPAQEPDDALESALHAGLLA